MENVSVLPGPHVDCGRIGLGTQAVWPRSCSWALHIPPGENQGAENFSVFSLGGLASCSGVTLTEETSDRTPHAHRNGNCDPRPEPTFPAHPSARGHSLKTPPGHLQALGFTLVPAALSTLLSHPEMARGSICSLAAPGSLLICICSAWHTVSPQ